MSTGEPMPTPDPLRTLWKRDQAPRPVTVDDLRAELTRRQRRMVGVVIGEVVLTAGLGMLTLTVFTGDGPATARTLGWLGLLWLTWLVVAAFATWNRWGAWRASAESAESYVALLEERTRRRRRVADFVLGLVAVQLVVFSPFGGVHPLGLVIIALYATWAVWYRGRASRELAAIRGIGAQLRGDDPAA
jgi:hypothetical protein